MATATTHNPAPVAATGSKSINRQVHVGNHIIVRLAGVDVGLVQSLRASDDYAPEPASGIGSITVSEYVPTVARHTISVSQMVLKAQNLRLAGVSEEDGETAVLGNVFDIVIASKDGFELRKYVGCSYASGDVEVSAHKIVVSNAQFNALEVVGTGI